MKKSLMLLMIICLATPSLVAAAEIIFSGQQNNQFDLFKANLSQGRVTQLTNTAADEIMPCVSSDGSLVAFVSDRQGANSLYLAKADQITSASYVSAAIGAYANPKFSPDGKSLLVRYSPDPEALLSNTQIVILDYAKKTQQVLIDSNKLSTPPSSETIRVVDWPVWVSENLVLYVVAELADEISGRMTRSTLYMYDVKNKRHIRVGGGESYFTASGRGMGFKATMPTLIEEAPGYRYVAFTAIRGNIEREPMQLSLTGSGKGVIALDDADFFGPLLFSANTWIYGTMDESSQTGISFKVGSLTAKPQKLNFPGAIIYPALLAP